MGFWKNPKVNAGTLALKLRDSKRQILFFQRAGIIPRSVNCSSCGARCTTIIYSTKQFKCSICKRGMSVFNNTFMCGLRCSIRKIVMMSKKNKSITTQSRYNFNLFAVYWFTMHPRMTQNRGKAENKFNIN